MGLMNSTSLDDLIKTDETVLSDELIKYLRRYIHVIDESNEAIQCSQ